MYQRGASKNYAKAALALASLYAGGKGVTQNYAETFRLCQVAADANDETGMYCVGKMYRDGVGTPKNPQKAAPWFQKASNFGNAGSFLELAEMYWNGEGVKADKVSAYVCASVAATRLPAAKKDLELFRASMTQQEIKKAESRMKKPSLQTPPVTN